MCGRGNDEYEIQNFLKIYLIIPESYESKRDEREEGHVVVGGKIISEVQIQLNLNNNEI